VDRVRVVAGRGYRRLCGPVTPKARRCQSEITYLRCTVKAGIIGRCSTQSKIPLSGKRGKNIVKHSPFCLPGREKNKISYPY